MLPDKRCATPDAAELSVPCLDTANAFSTAAPFLHHRRTPHIVLMAVSLGSARQLQLPLDNDDDDNDHDGDDEQDYDDDDPTHSRSRSHSPVPQAPTLPVAAQQQQQQLPPPPPTLRQQQPQPTPTPSPFGAHVHFHSRVRITSGLRHSRGNTSIGGDSDSDSPSSSISAPLRYRSHDTVPRLPLGERVSRLAAQALQKRRRTAAAAAAAVTSSPASRRLRATNHEHTPFLRAGVPVTYGAVQRGDSEDRSQVGGWHGEDAVGFGRWPWRALNRQVSSGSLLFVQKRSVRL